MTLGLVRVMGAGVVVIACVIEVINILSLSTIVRNSRDRPGKFWLMDFLHLYQSS